MKIRLEVTPEVYARLCGAITQASTEGGILGVNCSEIDADKFPTRIVGYGLSGPSKSFVELIRAKTDRSDLLEVDLEVTESMNIGEILQSRDVRDNKQILVSRDKINALFDLLGLFPRSEKGITGPTWPQK